MSDIAVFLLITAAIVAAVLLAAKRQSRSKTSEGTKDLYYLRPAVATPAERSFLGVLQSLDYEGITILLKVRIADVVGVRKGLEASDRQSALNRVASKHVDFLLIRTSDTRPVVAIELDDRSHDRPDRVERDGLVDEVFHRVGLPVLHIRASAAYSPQEVHAAIDQAIAARASDRPQPPR